MSHKKSLPCWEALSTDSTEQVLTRSKYTMFDKDFFQEEQQAGPGRAGRTVGNIGSWGLHIALLTFMIYSGYHGISATATYRADSGLGMAAGIVGIVTIELVLASLYLAWHNGKITGAAQSIAAGATYAIGFILACLGIVADSQLQAGLPLSSWLAAYISWGLPIAPAIMALGALLTHELSPGQLRARRESEKRDEVDEARFKAHMARLLAEMEAAKTVANMQLNARTAAAQQIAQWYSGEQAQRAIVDTARTNAPALLRAIGVDIADESRRPSSGGQAPSLAELAQYLREHPEGLSQLEALLSQAGRPSTMSQAPAANGHKSGDFLA